MGLGKCILNTISCNNCQSHTFPLFCSTNVPKALANKGIDRQRLMLRDIFLSSGFKDLTLHVFRMYLQVPTQRRLTNIILF